MAIIYSYPETLELLSTDMLIGTSTIRVAGKKKNITKNFTLELLKNFILDGHIGVQWGTITGILSNQTDLQAALNAKQNNITLTTTGSAGPATLVGATLNIPDYSGDAVIPTLNQVLTAGNTSLLNAKIGELYLYDTANADYGRITNYDSAFISYDYLGNMDFRFSSADDVFTLYNSTNKGATFEVSGITDNRQYTLPNATGTIALTSDIPSITPSALTKVDDTNVTLTLGGTPNTALLQGVSLTLGWAGTLADSRIASASTWNAKQDAITLTTTGTGAATLISNVLNIPTPPTAAFTSLTTSGTFGLSTLIGGVLNVPGYTLAGLGGVPTSRTLTINGTAYDLSADRTWSVGTVTSVTATSPITSTGGATPVISTSMATNKLIGRSTAGTGVMEEIAIGTGLTLSAGTLSNANSGTVTSVGLTMPAAFTVSNSPITGAGTIAVTGAGTASQYIRGDGALATYNPGGGGGGGASVSYYLNGSVSQGTIGGVAYKEMNSVPVIGAGTNFTINADGYIAQFITDAGDPNKLLIPAGNWNFETYFNASSGGGSPSFYVELYKYDGTTFTLIASSSASPELITGGTSIDLYFTALAIPATTLLVTDRLAVRFYVTHSGRTITMHTEDNNLCQAITTFSTGLTALNGLTTQVQNFATGTSGSDFNISSITDTHTFNLPTASASNRGALSTTDWSTFNGKQNTITLTNTGSSGASTFNSATGALNIPEYTLVGLGGISLTSLSSTATGLTYTNTTGVFSLTSGYLIPTTASYNNTNWDTAYTNRITSLTTTGTGAATLISNVLNIPTPPAATFTSLTVLGNSGSASLTAGVLNIPTYTLSGLVGQPLAVNLTSLSGLTYASTSFVKMTASGTFALDTNTYITSVGTGVANELTYWSGTNALGSLTTATYPSLTELSYVKGVTSSIQTQLNSKFTLPSLTSGSVLFSNGSTIAQDNANFFWDDANNRLGIGTASPSSRLDITGTRAGLILNNITVQNASNTADTEAGMFFAPTTATGNIRGAIITGIQEDGNNAIGLKFYTGLGPSITEKMRIDSTGNVGIGTASPTAIGGNITTLDIKGSGGGGIRSGVAGGSESTFYTIAGGGYLGTISNIPLNLQTNNSVKATILANGNVGIGTDAPLNKLHVDGASGIRISDATNSNFRGISFGAISTSSTEYAYIKYMPNSGEMRYWANPSGFGGFTTFYSNNAESMRIDSTGNIGINTTSPDQKLTVSGNIRAGGVGNGFLLDTLGVNYTNGMKTVNNYETVMFSGRGSAGYVIAGDNDVRFGFGSTYTSGEKMRITSAGNVGIGTSSPGVKFVNSGGNWSSGPTLGSGTVGSQALLERDGNYGMYSGVDYTTGDVWHQVQRNDGIAVAYNLALQPSGGNIYIGTNAPIYSTPAKLQILFNGLSEYGLNFKTGAAAAIPISFIDNASFQIGRIYYDATGTYYQTFSDYRLKEDLKPINGLELVSKMKVYDYKVKLCEKRSYGVLAHELQEVVPQIVFGEKDGKEMQGIDYSKLVPILIQAIQDQQKQIDELKKLIK